MADVRTGLAVQFEADAVVATLPLGVLKAVWRAAWSCGLISAEQRGV